MKPLISMITSEICEWQVIIKRFILKICVCLESRITSIFPFLLFGFNFGEGSCSLFLILLFLCSGRTEFCCFKLCLATDVLSHFKVIFISYEFQFCHERKIMLWKWKIWKQSKDRPDYITHHLYRKRKIKRYELPEIPFICTNRWSLFYKNPVVIIDLLIIRINMPNFLCFSIRILKIFLEMRYNGTIIKKVSVTFQEMQFCKFAFSVLLNGTINPNLKEMH